MNVAGTGRGATSDAKGRFKIDSVPEGAQTFTMQHAAFDSLGLSGASARVIVQQKTPRVILAVPAFETLWRALCGDVPAPKDSSLVYGRVSEPRADSAVAGTRVELSWIDLVGGGKSLGSISQRRWKRTVMTDDRGEYAICGVPANTALTLKAGVDSATATSVEFGAATARVQRHDVLLALPVGQPARTPADSPNAAPAAVASTSGALTVGGFVSGIVTNSQGIPIAGASIAIDTLPEIRTGDDGRFAVSNVPPGTRSVSIVSIGMQPHYSNVNVHVKDTTRLTIPMTSVQTLSEVAVTAKANTVAGMRERTFLEHKSLGLGQFRDSTAIGNATSMLQPFQTLAGVTTRGTPSKFSISSRTCPEFSIVLDGHPTIIEVLGTLDPKSVAAFEIYHHRYMYPSDIVGGKSCTLAVWTKAALGK